ncbi:unnamed protein product [Mytilus coruscus]|uniref:C-type lectin domain-containing protein n=1 Tax=Mytilus coruscus TaxID=42192 RepID=A0A6J8BTY3_MYTCO|nr:unnamed protein product [Mytilus coruscus]
MGDVDNVYEQRIEDQNAANQEYSIPTNVWNNKLADLYKASRKRDKLFVLLVVMQLICLSVAVAFIVMHFNGEHGQKGEKGSPGEPGEQGQKGEQGRPGESGTNLLSAILDFEGSSQFIKKDMECGKGDVLYMKITLYEFNKNTGHVWIGAHDSVIESRFIWESDNTNLTYTDWNPGEPNNAGRQEDCVHMNNKAAYKWNDIQCSHVFSYICEKH